MKSKGFTLAEVIVSSALLVLISMGISAFGRDIFSLNSGLSQNMTAQMEGRKVLKTLISELRSASPSSLGAYPIAQAGTSSLIFYSNIDSDQQKERLRYFLEGTDLKRGVINPSGNPLTYPVGSEKIELLVRDVRNEADTPMFSYFDEMYAGTTSPLSIPVTVTSVRLIRATVIIDADQNRSPGPIIITSQGVLRNLKDNL
jgi:prepilin-type N-terminal cleavage/methylation domain-containing protein